MRGHRDRILLRSPETPLDPMKFLSYSRSASSLEPRPVVILSDSPEFDLDQLERSSLSLGCLSNSSSLLNGRYPTHSTPISPPALDDLKEGSSLSSNFLSHSSSLLHGGHLTHNTPISHPVLDDLKYTQTASATSMVPQLGSSSSDRIVGRWIKERRDRKKEKTHAHKAQLNAAVSIAGAASSAAALAVATASETEKITVSKQLPYKRSTAAMLVAAQSVEAAKAMGAADDHLASFIETASSVRNSEGIATLTATAATALKGAAHLKGNKASREMWGITAEKCDRSSHSENSFLCQHQVKSSTTSDWKSAELRYEENFLGICSREVLARGAQLLKRTRNGALHWKIVSVYMSKMGRVTLKMKSKHIAGTITKMKKNVIVEVCKTVQAWPRRFIPDGEEQLCYFGLKTSDGRIIEFECKTKREHEIWTQGVTYLLNISREGRRAGPHATTS